MGLQALLEGYQSNMAALTQSVQKLEEQSESIAAQGKERRRSQARTEALQRTVAALQGERQDLLGRWTEAEFNEDVAEQKSIKARRKAVDEEIAQAQEIIRSEQESMTTVNEEQSANLAVQKDILRLPITRELADKVAEIINEESNDLRKRVATISVPDYEQKTYDRLRGNVDAAYSLYLSNEKRLQKLEDERRAKMTNASSTDAMHDQQHKRYKPDPRLEVTAGAYETNPDGVLSGDTIARVLAEKQNSLLVQ